MVVAVRFILYCLRTQPLLVQTPSFNPLPPLLALPTRQALT